MRCYLAGISFYPASYAHLSRLQHKIRKDMALTILDAASCLAKRTCKLIVDFMRPKAVVCNYRLRGDFI